MIIENKFIDKNLITQNNEDKAPARCVECDRVMEHYITFTSPTNADENICWECYDRGEKGFNTKRNFRRSSRSGVIPR